MLIFTLFHPFPIRLSKSYQRRYPLYLGTGIYAILKGSVGRQTARMLFDFNCLFICQGVRYRKHHMDAHNFGPSRRGVLRNLKTMITYQSDVKRTEADKVTE